MDLCCLIDSKERLSASDLVTMLGDLLERETKFHVKPLPHARIPIVKLSLDPSPGLPLGIACDIGFENRLALENTRLLMCYAMIDPTRVRTLVLFLKVWSKRRKINSPYKGTLSSYGYVLLVIYFLVHVKNPPVLPNLQQMPPLRPISKEETTVNGHNVWFFDDVELLRTRWHSENQDSVAELLIDFFRYFSRDFSYNTAVASARAGLLRKESKGWQNDLSSARYHDARERNRFCIEDPFEVDFNVARCVTKDGLYTIRGEFMRAARILASRPERAVVALAQLCEERKDETLVPAPATPAHRLSSLPPQTPYTVGSHSMRPKGSPVVERLSPPTEFVDTSPDQVQGQPPPPPPHMAPKRSKWTSPPPPEAPSADHKLFQSRLQEGLERATAPTEARQSESAYHSSSSNSEILSDEEHSDLSDVGSTKSFTEGAFHVGPPRRPMWVHHENGAVRPQLPTEEMQATAQARSRGPLRAGEGSHIRPGYHQQYRAMDNNTREMNRRSWSGPPRALKVTSWHPPVPPPISELSSVSAPRHQQQHQHQQLQQQQQQQYVRQEAPTNVFYETAANRSPTTPNVLYSPGSPFLLSQYFQQLRMQSQQEAHSPTHADSPQEEMLPHSAGPNTPTPFLYAENRLEQQQQHHQQQQQGRRPRHAHTHSSSTIVPGPHIPKHVVDTSPSIPPRHSPATPPTPQSGSRSRSRQSQRPSPLIPSSQPPIVSGNDLVRFIRPPEPNTSSVSPPTTSSDRSDSPAPSSMYSARSRSFSPSPPPPADDLIKGPFTIRHIVSPSPRIPNQLPSPILTKNTPLQAYMTPSAR